MHQIRSTDIVEGNMKSIMRLILALAAHFKVGYQRCRPIEVSIISTFKNSVLSCGFMVCGFGSVISFLSAVIKMLTSIIMSLYVP